MASFDLETTWQFAVPVGVVFDALTDSPQWPTWWPGLVEVQPLVSGNADGIGRTQRFVWKSRLGYRLRFDIRITRVHRPCLIEGEASGDVAGIGRWHLHDEQGGTRVRYAWQVRTVRPWMSLLAGLARPLVVWNHHAMMREGCAGLTRYLDSETEPSACKAGRLASRETP